jgi:hypothetical protein
MHRNCSAKNINVIIETSIYLNKISCVLKINRRIYNRVVKLNAFIYIIQFPVIWYIDILSLMNCKFLWKTTLVLFA